jgi:hypothetical protein
MVDGIASNPVYDPLAYLNKVKGTAPAPQQSQTTSPSQATNPLQSPSPVSVGPDVLSVLQSTDPNSFQGQQLSNLLGGVGNSNALAGLYGVAINKNSTLAPLQNALNSLQQQKAQLSTQSDFVGKAIADRNKATNAYNKTLITNAQAAVTASYNPLPSA